MYCYYFVLLLFFSDSLLFLVSKNALFNVRASNISRHQLNGSKNAQPYDDDNSNSNSGSNVTNSGPSFKRPTNQIYKRKCATM